MGAVANWVEVIELLFFRKRCSAPILLIWMLWITTAYMVVCGLLTSRLVPLEDEGILATGAEYVRDLIFLIIWSRYLIVSRRVKATFVKRLNPQLSEAGAGSGLSGTMPAS